MLENQRVRLSKKMLKDSLIKLLNEKSIHKISVIELCERAQINRTTFYKYYGSQYDLLGDMENDILTQIDNYLKAGDGLEDTITGQLVRIIEFIDDNIDFCKLLLNNNVDPEFPEKLIQLPSIRQLIAQQLTDKYNEDELMYTLNFVIAGSFSTLQKWMNKENRESPKEMNAFLNNIIFTLLPV